MNHQPESTPIRLSLSYVAPPKVGFPYSLLKIELLRSLEVDNRMALLPVVAPLPELIAGNLIGLNSLALTLRCLRIMPSTACSMAGYDGDRNDVPLEIEKLLQSYAGKYPTLSMDFSLFMWGSGTAIGVIEALAIQDRGYNGIDQSLHKKLTDGLNESELISITWYST